MVLYPNKLPESERVCSGICILGHANLETTMSYLDITTEQESKALATLESENEQSIPKKWKMESNSLAMFLGIKNIDNNK